MVNRTFWIIYFLSNTVRNPAITSWGWLLIPLFTYMVFRTIPGGSPYLKNGGWIHTPTFNLDLFKFVLVNFYGFYNGKSPFGRIFLELCPVAIHKQLTQIQDKKWWLDFHGR